MGEFPQDRPECVSGTVYFVSRYALDRCLDPDHIKIHNTDDGNDYYIKKDKHYITIDGEVYIKYLQDENDSPYYSHIKHNL